MTRIVYEMGPQDLPPLCHANGYTSQLSFGKQKIGINLYSLSSKCPFNPILNSVFSPQNLFFYFFFVVAQNPQNLITQESMGSLIS